MQSSKVPILSVIMPVYNAEKYLEDAVLSILNQTFTDFELLIGDDGSFDKSKEIIDEIARKDKRIKPSHNPTNLGKIDTVNRLYANAKGIYVVFHDADDISHHHRFRLQIDVLDNDNSIGLVGSGYLMVDQQNRIIDSIQPSLSHDSIISSMRKSSQFHFPAVMFRKSAIDSEDELFRGFFGYNNEDVDLTLRILTKSKGANIDSMIYVYRILENSISRNKLLRKSIYYYSIAKDLAISRLSGEGDWLCDDKLRIKKLEKYDSLNDTSRIIIFANSVSYFLSYRMYYKAIKSALLSVRYVHPLEGTKLVLVTVYKIVKKRMERFDTSEFNLELFQKRMP